MVCCDWFRGGFAWVIWVCLGLFYCFLLWLGLVWFMVVLLFVCVGVYCVFSVWALCGAVFGLVCFTVCLRIRVD